MELTITKVRWYYLISWYRWIHFDLYFEKRRSIVLIFKKCKVNLYPCWCVEYIYYYPCHCSTCSVQFHNCVSLPLWCNVANVVVWRGFLPVITRNMMIILKWLYKGWQSFMRNHKISINPAILHLTRKYCVVRWRGYCFRFFYFFYQLHFASIRQLWLHIKMKQITWAMSQAGRAIRS